MQPQSMTDPEEWRPIPGYEGSYEASNRGRIRRTARDISLCSCDECHRKFPARVLKGFTGAPHGYITVTPSVGGIIKTELAHRLVALAFLGPPQTGRDIVNHKDGDKQNNRPENLEWTNPSENALHAYRTGLHDRSGAWATHGEGHPKAVLTDDKVRWIRGAIGTRTVTQIARELGVGRETVRVVLLGLTWRHVK